MDTFFEFLELFEKLPEFDLLYLLINIYFLYKGIKKGFVLSLLSAAKWVLAYIITIYIFPKVF